ncbi:hypothetical protein [Acinetobacter bereziniae]|uniref:hypothetical protein n=1 Tax=Acinetobacter bereziniae TaxID=106648 RepID=UPI0021E40C73|nr:hypothetical protein [Acinetobacter bereziniae]MCV2443872.1 hypothetical protein [Acinetobacter bereziniae]
MTFIVAIQLNDSVVIAADNKKVILKESMENQLNVEMSSKIYSWDNGIITGTGEAHVVHRSVELFKKLAQSDIHKLPQCLKTSRQMRELEIGTNYYQVENTKLLCSSYSNNGAQLYKVKRFDPLQPYKLVAVEPLDISVWLFHPNIENISTDLQDLYRDLKDYSAFNNETEWINHYINRIAVIYQKQSLCDPLMSQSFDIFFQSKEKYFFGHVPNTQDEPLEVKRLVTKP